ncbi:MAG TPA: low affinity iron permease family protein [Tepidisphaeraceae bacterium]|nr:low affinity iron permease family protein [Tepidisphaeraceae bacterium]
MSTQPQYTTSSVDPVRPSQLRLHNNQQNPAPPPGGSSGQVWFRWFAHWASERVGSPGAFTVAVGVVLLWAISGPIFGFSDTWQLVINTGTTIVTFLMVFLIQNTQNRDAKAMQLKLDELIRSVSGARDQLVDLENLSDEQLEQLQRQFQRLRERAVNRHQDSTTIEPSR